MMSLTFAPLDIIPLTSSFLDYLDYTLGYRWTGVACLFALIIYIVTRPENPYDGIPAVGRTGFLTSYIDAIQFLKRGNEFLQEGYDKYHPGAFRIPELKRWHVIVTGEKLIEELRKAPDTSLSFDEAVKDFLATDWTLGPNVSTDGYHISIVRAQLTHNLGGLFSDLHEEIALAFNDSIPVTDDWTSVNALETVMRIISRISNRVFVGAPLCRDAEYTALNIQFTLDVVLGAQIICLFPDFLKPIAGRLFTNVPKSIRTAMKHLKPIIEERQRKIDEYGLDYPDKPVRVMVVNDHRRSRGEERSVRNLTLRILVVNFSAIHTTSTSFTHALFELASRPKYVQPLRDEVESVTAEQGWTKAAMSNMRKLDSFLKENQRLTGVGGISMSRIALKGFTFSDGTRIPRGGLVSAVSTARHLDDRVYPDAAAFNGFRFSEMQDGEGEEAKNQMVATSTEYLPFGHGRHACPGRFFATNELKAMLAHIVLTYDIKVVTKPKTSYFASAAVPDRNARVMFRRRT